MLLFQTACILLFPNMRSQPNKYCTNINSPSSLNQTFGNAQNRSNSLPTSVHTAGSASVLGQHDLHSQGSFICRWL
jgi:hypothetical protein